MNPSRREFADAQNKWLRGSERRLATTESLGLADLTQANDQQVGEVVAECYNYFQRNPYLTWFRPLETLFGTATGTSYLDGTACHLDLVQWATDPVWSKLSPTVRAQLIEEDREFLRQQLQWERLELVLLNGITVVRQVRAMSIELEQ